MRIGVASVLHRYAPRTARICTPADARNLLPSASPLPPALPRCPAAAARAHTRYPPRCPHYTTACLIGRWQWCVAARALLAHTRARTHGWHARFTIHARRNENGQFNSIRTYLTYQLVRLTTTYHTHTYTTHYLPSPPPTPPCTPHHLRATAREDYLLAARRLLAPVVLCSSDRNLYLEQVECRGGYITSLIQVVALNDVEGMNGVHGTRDCCHNERTSLL